MAINDFPVSLSLYPPMTNVIAEPFRVLPEKSVELFTFGPPPAEPPELDFPLSPSFGD